MGKYIVQLSKRALKDLQAIKKSGRKLDMKKYLSASKKFINFLNISKNDTTK